jgi:hypothetical protein
MMMKINDDEEGVDLKETRRSGGGFCDRETLERIYSSFDLVPFFRFLSHPDRRFSVET